MGEVMANLMGFPGVQQMTSFKHGELDSLVVIANRPIHDHEERVMIAKSMHVSTQDREVHAPHILTPMPEGLYRTAFYVGNFIKD
jgi:hypothetical protein